MMQNVWVSNGTLTGLCGRKWTRQPKGRSTAPYICALIADGAFPSGRGRGIQPGHEDKFTCQCRLFWPSFLPILAQDALTAPRIWNCLMKRKMFVEWAVNSTLRGTGLEMNFWLAVPWCVDRTAGMKLFDEIDMGDEWAVNSTLHEN
jgi:hypothetical protein